MTNILLVISRYMEDLEWLQKEEYNKYSYIVYNKGTNSDFCKTDKFIKEIRLPNVGREVHTYFYHIIENYDNLNDMTIFLPGSMELKHKAIKGKALMRQIEITPSTTTYVCDRELKGYYVLYAHMNLALSKYTSSCEKNKNENKDDNMELCSMRPYGKWYMRHFNKNIPNVYSTYNSIFGLSRQIILSKFVQYYKKLIEEVDKHHNPEVVHYYERSWYSVFYESTIETIQVYTSFSDEE